MVTTQYKRAAGLFYSRDEAEKAVRELKQAGFDMDRVSVIAKDADQVAGHDTTEDIGNKADEGAGTGAVTGGILGGLTGLLVGLGTLAIPGVGPILLAGEVATALATTAAGAGIGAAAGGLIGALIGLGIPEEKAKIYNDRVSGGSFLVMVTGNSYEVDRAAAIMRDNGVEEFDIYDMPGATAPAVADVDEDIQARTDLDDDGKIRLYEERLTVNKQREKAGEVKIGKHVETQTAEVAIPVERERIVIERTDGIGTAVAPGTATFAEGGVAKVDLYEETANVQKQAFVREEVSVRKEVETETVSARETIRREELDVEADGDVIER